MTLTEIQEFIKRREKMMRVETSLLQLWKQEAVEHCRNTKLTKDNGYNYPYVKLALIIPDLLYHRELCERFIKFAHTDDTSGAS